MTRAKSQSRFVVAIFLLVTGMLVAQEGKYGQTNAADAQGPRGTLQIKGISGHDSVYLNGTSRDFFIGHVDDVKGDRVVLPVGQQHVIIVDPSGDRQVYSAYVVIQPGKRAILRVDKSSIDYEKWSGGGPLTVPATTAGANAMVVPPVTGQVVAYPAKADCGQPVRLVWTSNGYNTLLKYNGVAIGKGGSSGEQVVDPKQTTTYQLETFGPGGVSMTPVTVYVNKDVKTSLTAAPMIVRYHKIGDKIIDPGTGTLNWTASNAKSVVLDPIGPVSGSSGTQEIAYTPTNSGYGPVQQTLDYKITATNDCGGSDSTTAQVQIAGSIDPEPPPDVLPAKLPQTASPLPLVGLLGLGFLASGLLLRRFRKS